jgi:hypothetical protein
MDEATIETGVPTRALVARAAAPGRFGHADVGL